MDNKQINMKSKIESKSLFQVRMELKHIWIAGLMIILLGTIVNADTFDEQPSGTAHISTLPILSDMLNTTIITSNKGSNFNVISNLTNIYYVNASGGKVYRSTNGIDFTLRGILPDSNKYPELFEIDSQGNLFAGLYNYNPSVAGAPLYASSDGGVSWVLVGNSSGDNWWGFDEYRAGGVLYASEYAVGSFTGLRLNRSTDYGNTWTTVYNRTGTTNLKHFHKILVDQSNGDVYISSGDATRYLNVSRDNGSTFNENIIVPNLVAGDDGFTAMFDDGINKYFALDRTTVSGIYKMVGTNILKRSLLLPTGYNDAIFSMSNNTENVVFAAVYNQTNKTNANSVWATPDNGSNWVMIYAKNEDYLKKITNEFNGYQFLGFTNDLERINTLAKNETLHLIYAPDDRKNNIVNSTITQNGTLLNNSVKYLSLYQDALSNVNITLTGINVTNIHPNPSFEVNTASWYGPNLSRNTTFSKFGIASAKVNSSAFTSNPAITIDNTSAYTFSVWLKGVDIPLKTYVAYIVEKNATDVTQRTTSFNYYNGTFDWVQMVGSFTPVSTTTKVVLTFQGGTGGTLFVDGVQLQRGNISTDFLNSASDTSAMNISILVGTQWFNSSNLNNGETQTFNLSGNFMGLIPITPSINGSGILNYSISGTRILSAESVLIENASGAYNISKVYNTSNAQLQFWTYNLTLIPKSPMTVNITTWNTTGDYYKKWNESSTNASTTTQHIIGDFPANTNIQIKRDGVNYAQLTSNATGYINWTYSGGYSEHQFEAELAAATATSLPIESSFPLWIIMLPFFMVMIIYVLINGIGKMNIFEYSLSAIIIGITVIYLIDNL